MFLIMGIQDGRKQLDFDQLVVCGACGKYGHVQVYMYYTYFMLFFIPVFKWNKRYVVVMNCCNSSCELDIETGMAIARGELSRLNEADLKFTRNYQNFSNKVCENCGYETSEDFDYCPKCGTKF